MGKSYGATRPAVAPRPAAGQSRRLAEKIFYRQLEAFFADDRLNRLEEKRAVAGFRPAGGLSDSSGRFGGVS